MWPDTKLLDLFGVELPIIQSPMVGASGSEMAIAVSQAGGLGSLPCAMLDVGRARAEIASIRQATSNPLNLNFFCNTPPKPNPDRDLRWQKRLVSYYCELEVDMPGSMPASKRVPFDAAMCEIVEEFKPEIVSFHFGLPE